MTSESNATSYEPLPEDVASWLSGHDWQRVTQTLGRPTLWVSGQDELLQPTLVAANDYDLRMSELFRKLSMWSERPADALAEEMIHEGSDISEWRAHGAHGRDYSVPLEDGLNLVQSVRNVFVAAANATVQRRGYFGLSGLKVAREHARVVRMGQTRRGSYIVPIISRVPGAVTQPDDGQSAFDIDVSAQPFERRVMAQLAEALATVEELAVKATQEPTQKQLNESIGVGVSYELCAAISHVLAAESFGDVDVSFTWARRAARHPDVSKIELPKQARGVINRMAETLRGSDVIAEQVVTGLVWQIKRDPVDDDGTVKMRAPIGTRLKTLTMTLTLEQTHEAAIAFDEKKPVYARGQLVRGQGRAWHFESISEFGIAEAAPLSWGSGEHASDPD